MDQARIDELRRRIDLDPTSIAFAELAEAYRGASRYTDAIALCRTGLARHPAYLSARVTLGRALTAVDDLPSAQAELEQVLRVAPTSLPALRALAEVLQRRGDSEQARALVERASQLAHEGLDLDESSAEIDRPPAPSASASEGTVASDVSPAPAAIATTKAGEPDAGRDRVEATAHEASPQLRALEGFLARIESASRRRRDSTSIA